jgi:hypothetical protein
MHDRLNQTPIPWKPEVGDELEGTVLEVDEYEGDHGPYPVVLVGTDDGKKVTVYGSRSVLMSKLAKKRPRVGDRIGIKYLGYPEGKSYHNYNVEVDPVDPVAQPEPDWDSMAANADAIAADAEKGRPIENFDDHDDEPF